MLNRLNETYQLLDEAEILLLDILFGWLLGLLIVGHPKHLFNASFACLFIILDAEVFFFNVKLIDSIFI